MDLDGRSQQPAESTEVIVVVGDEMAVSQVARVKGG